MISKEIRTKLVAVVVAVQMLFFVSWYYIEAGGFSSKTKTILVKTQPYDPRSFLSGQYLQIRYSFSSTTPIWNNETGSPKPQNWAENLGTIDTSKRDVFDVWVILKEIEGFYEPISASRIKPQNLNNGEVVIKGTHTGYGNILYGVEKYFVPEGTMEPAAADTNVELDVFKDGKVKISKVLVNGNLWP